MYQINEPFEFSAEHGEGPVWDPESGLLYWVDILQNRYFKGNPATGEVSSYDVGQPIGVLALKKSGGVITALRDGYAHFDEELQKTDLIYNTVDANPGTRFNDGAVDPRGRFLAGTMTFNGEEQIGKLFSLDTDFKATELETSLFIPNGMDWAGDTFYLTDTNQHLIFAYDYDLGTGRISNRRPFIEFADDEYPDGCCIDSQGGFWVAMWGGGKLCRFDKNGNKIEEIDLPVAHPTSCCFGGEDLNILFITTSRLLLSEAEIKDNPQAGKLLSMDTELKGRPNFKFG